MNLNIIPVNGGTWEHLSNLLDYNFLSIQSRLPRVLIKRPNKFKGLFLNLSDAQAAIPNPADGTFFFLVSAAETGPFTIYYASEGVWRPFSDTADPAVLDQYIIPNEMDSYGLHALIGIDIKFDLMAAGSVVDTTAFGAEYLEIPSGINRFRINANGVKIDDNLVVPGEYRFNTYSELVQNPETTFLEYNNSNMSYSYEFSTDVLRHYRYSEGGWEVKLGFTAWRAGQVKGKTFTTYKIIRFG